MSDPDDPRRPRCERGGDRGRHCSLSHDLCDRGHHRRAPRRPLWREVGVSLGTHRLHSGLGLVRARPIRRRAHRRGSSKGASAALMVPQVLATAHVLFPDGERARAFAVSRAFAVYGLALGFGGAVGFLLGGILVTLNPAGLGWRAVFFVNAPLGLAIALAAWRLMPRVPAAFQGAARLCRSERLVRRALVSHRPGAGGARLCLGDLAVAGDAAGYPGDRRIPLPQAPVLNAKAACP